MPNSVVSIAGSVRSLSGSVINDVGGAPCCCGGTPPQCECETFPHPTCNSGPFGPGGAHTLTAGSYYLTPALAPAIGVQTDIVGTCCYGPNARIRENIEAWLFCDVPPSGVGNCPGSLYQHTLLTSEGPLSAVHPGTRLFVSSNGCCTPIVVNQTTTYNASFGTTSTPGRGPLAFYSNIATFLPSFPSYRELSGGFVGTCTAINAYATGRIFVSTFGWLRFQIRYLAFVDPDNAECYPQECHRACCLPSGMCLDHLNPDQCRALGGIPQIPYSTCYSAQCNVPGTAKGACCNPTTGGCVLTLAQDCVPPNTFMGLGTLCDGGPSEFQCPQPTGKCCVPSGGGGYTCTPGLTPAQCNALNGLWGGPGTLCVGTPCPGAGGGACCMGDSNCQQVGSAQECINLGGSFMGVGSDCQIVNCFGACCYLSGGVWTCSEGYSPQQCATVGTFLGLGSTCSPPPWGPGCIGGRPGVPGFSRGLVLPDGTPAASVGQIVKGCAGCGGAKGERV